MTSTMEIYDQERGNVPRCAEIAPEQRRLIGALSLPDPGYLLGMLFDASAGRRFCEVAL